MNNSERSGSRLFPGGGGGGEKRAISVSSIDSSVKLFLDSGVFAKIDDGGGFVGKIKTVMSGPLENLKNMLTDSPVADKVLVAQYLSDAFINVRQFIVSDESKAYLADFMVDNCEGTAAEIMNEVQKCLTWIAERMGADNEFLKQIAFAGVVPTYQVRKDTVPYGTKTIEDKEGTAVKAPFLSFEPEMRSRQYFVRSTTQEFPAMNLVEAVRNATLEAATVTEAVPEALDARTASTPPSRNTLPPPSMGMRAPAVEIADKEADAKKYFKQRFLEVYKNEFLKKLRDIGESKSDSKNKEEKDRIFEEAFDYICRKTYLVITSDATGNSDVMALHGCVEKRVSEGADWKAVIRHLGENAVATEAMETMRIYVPIIAAAYLSHDKYRETIMGIKDGNEEDFREKQEDAAKCILDYIRDQMFNSETSSKIDALVYLAYFFRETRSDLGLIFYEEVYKSAGEFFAKLRNVAPLKNTSDVTVTKESGRAQDNDETIPVTLMGTGIEPIPYTVHLETEIQADALLNLFAEDEDDENTIVTEKETLPTLAANTEEIQPTIPVKIIENNDPGRGAVQREKNGGFWSRLKNSKVAKVAAGVTLAAATVLAGYGVSSLTNSGKQESTDSTQAAASSQMSGTASSTASVAASPSTVANADNLSVPDISSPDNDQLPETTPSPETADPETTPEAAQTYAVHLEKIAGDDTRLKNLVQNESFNREPGNRGDFEQLHSIVAQGALTAAQQNMLQDQLNDKYNRGEYGSATRRFRPLLENGELFKVLGNANHPEHNSLKAAVSKFGNPSLWSWNRKKPVLENGKVQFKSVHYEDLHSEDVEFFQQCQKDFEAMGIGKNGNVHHRGGEAGEKIPLKINGKWITFVETALQIRGVIEARGVQEIPAPPASILNDAATPADTTPTNTAPVDMEIDLQPDGRGKEGFLHLDSPEIEMGETVMMAMSDLEDDPEIVIGEEVEVDLSDLEDYPEIEIGEMVELAMSDLEDDPEIEIGETEMDDETLLALIDDGWDSEEIENSIEKTLQKVKLAA